MRKAVAYNRWSASYLMQVQLDFVTPLQTNPTLIGLANQF